jgi:hypothetical protein
VLNVLNVSGEKSPRRSRPSKTSSLSSPPSCAVMEVGRDTTALGGVLRVIPLATPAAPEASQRLPRHLHVSTQHGRA